MVPSSSSTIHPACASLDEPVALPHAHSGNGNVVDGKAQGASCLQIFAPQVSPTIATPDTVLYRPSPGPATHEKHPIIRPQHPSLLPPTATLEDIVRTISQLSARIDAIEARNRTGVVSRRQVVDVSIMTGTMPVVREIRIKASSGVMKWL